MWKKKELEEPCAVFCLCMVSWCKRDRPDLREREREREVRPDRSCPDLGSIGAESSSRAKDAREGEENLRSRHRRSSLVCAMVRGPCWSREQNTRAHHRESITCPWSGRRSLVRPLFFTFGHEVIPLSPLPFPLLRACVRASAVVIREKGWEVGKEGRKRRKAAAPLCSSFYPQHHPIPSFSAQFF